MLRTSFAAACESRLPSRPAATRSYGARLQTDYAWPWRPAHLYVRLHPAPVLGSPATPVTGSTAGLIGLAAHSSLRGVRARPFRDSPPSWGSIPSVLTTQS